MTDKDQWPPPYPASTSQSPVPSTSAVSLDFHASARQHPGAGRSNVTLMPSPALSQYTLPPNPRPPTPAHSSSYAPGGPVADFLAALNLLEYYQAFLQEGFDRMSSVMELTEDDMEALGVKRGHRRTIQRQIATLKGLPTSAPLPLKKRKAIEGPPESPPPAVRSAVSPVSQINSNTVIFKSGKAEALAREDSVPLPSGKRRYRRHPKPDVNAPEKPSSAYVNFSNGIRHELKGSKSFSELARIVGERWKNLDPGHKEALEQAAARAKEQYHAALASYKQTDDHAEYQKYLADFKARHGQEEDMPPARGSRAKGQRAASALTVKRSGPLRRKTVSDDDEDSEEPDDTYEEEGDDRRSIDSTEAGSECANGIKRQRPSVSSVATSVNKRSTNGSTASSILFTPSLMPSPRPSFGSTPSSAVGPVVSSSRSTLEEPMTYADTALAPLPDVSRD